MSFYYRSAPAILGGTSSQTSQNSAIATNSRDMQSKGLGPRGHPLNRTYVITERLSRFSKVPPIQIQKSDVDDNDSSRRDND